MGRTNERLPGDFERGSERSMTPDEMPRVLLDALAAHEGFRRLGFESKDIYLVLQDGRVFVMLRKDGTVLTGSKVIQDCGGRLRQSLSGLRRTSESPGLVAHFGTAQFR